MEDKSIVTCSFSMDREIYNAYKSIVVRKGDTVKGNLIKFMKAVIDYDTPNVETIIALREVEELKNNPNTKAYSSSRELMEALDS